MGDRSPSLSERRASNMQNGAAKASERSSTTGLRLWWPVTCVPGSDVWRRTMMGQFGWPRGEKPQVWKRHQPRATRPHKTPLLNTASYSNIDSYRGIGFVWSFPLLRWFVVRNCPNSNCPRMLRVLNHMPRGEKPQVWKRHQPRAMGLVGTEEHRPRSGRLELTPYPDRSSEDDRSPTFHSIS